MASKFIVFTDMDGTLLDHFSYSHEPAKAMLAKLKELQIPVIPNTSKTFDELIVLRKQLSLEGPFIVENGAAIHIPHGSMHKKPANTQWLNQHWVKQFTSKKSYWLNLLNRIKGDFVGQFNHFSEMSIEQIQEATGLSKDEARRAASRQFGEPVLWLGTEQQKQHFINTMKSVGARPLQGGRFIHISGDCDKGSALNWFMQECRRQQPDIEFVSIALGDGENDVAMLEAADYAVRVRSPTHLPPHINKHTNVLTTTQMGPQGWSDALATILDIRP